MSFFPCVDLPAMTTILRHNGITVVLLLRLGIHGRVSANSRGGEAGGGGGGNQKLLPLWIFLIVLFTVLFLFKPAIDFIKRCIGTSNGGRRHEPSAPVVETFPPQLYSEVKKCEIGKEVLECAVCLGEFKEKETLRLMVKCEHAFHQKCIDQWLASHVTCPVCRAKLIPQPTEGDGGSSSRTQTELDVQVLSPGNEDAELRVPPQVNTYRFTVLSSKCESATREVAPSVVKAEC